MFSRINESDSFYIWEREWNSLADDMNPAGSGSLSLYNVYVDGSITFGSAYLTGPFTIQKYDLDLYSPPEIKSKYDRICSDMRDNKRSAISFILFPDNFSLAGGTSVPVYFGCSSNWSGTSNIVIAYSYWINRNNIALSTTPDGTGVKIIDFTGTSGEYRKIEVADVLMNENYSSVIIRIERIGTSILDSCSGSVYLFDVKAG